MTVNEGLKGMKLRCRPTDFQKLVFSKVSFEKPGRISFQVMQHVFCCLLYFSSRTLHKQSDILSISVKFPP